LRQAYRQNKRRSIMLNSAWAIIGTIVLGVATNLLTPYVSKWLGNVSSAIRKKNEQKKLIFENTVKYIIENPQEEIILRIRYMQRGLVSLLAVTIGFVFMITNNGLFIVFGFVFSILGYYGYSKTDKFGKILKKVTENKNANRPGVDLD
jgi:hypothetical protein